MIRSLFVVAISSFGLAASAVQTEPPTSAGVPDAPPYEWAEPGTFALDPVELIETGRVVPVSDHLTMTHGGFTYGFSSIQNFKRFEADPSRYAVRQGGACARMGSMSGVGRSDLWWVHEGSLYFAASESCRSTFRRMPERVLESDDPAMNPSENERAAGDQTLARAAEWMGGRDALLALRGYRYSRSSETVPDNVDEANRDAMTVRRSRAFTVNPRGGSRLTQTFNERVTEVVTGADTGFFVNNREVRLMDRDQHRESQRRLALQLPVLLAAWSRGECEVRGLGPHDSLDGERVAVLLHGRRVELVVAAEGRILAMGYRGWGGEHFLLGACERRFTAFEVIGGIRFPTGYERWYEGERTPDGDLEPGADSVSVLARLDGSMFEPPLPLP